MFSGHPPKLTPMQQAALALEVSRARRKESARKEAIVVRARNFRSAIDQLYAERMVRTTNLATVRCPDGDVALARRLVADQLTFEADMDRRFPTWAAGLLAGGAR